MIALGSINGVRTDRQVSTQLHNIAMVGFSSARGAFLIMLRLNWWGLAYILSRTAFFVSEDITKTQSAPNYWWEVQARWRNAWWNMGGNWDSFLKAVDKGKGKRPFAMWTATGKIKDALKEAKLGTTKDYEQPIGAEPTTTWIAANIGTIITVLGSVIVPTIGIIATNSSEKRAIEDGKRIDAMNVSESEKNRQLARERIAAEKEIARLKAEEEGLSFTDEEGNLTTAGYGAVGVGVLGLLFLGTSMQGKKKNKK